MRPFAGWQFAIIKPAQGRDIKVSLEMAGYKAKMEAEREKLRNELEEALAEVKTLSGFLPVCSNCKDIRDDEGYWQKMEQYISERSEAQFSHGICPKCVKELYPEFNLDEWLEGPYIVATNPSYYPIISPYIAIGTEIISVKFCPPMTMFPATVVPKSGFLAAHCNIFGEPPFHYIQ